MKSPGWFEQRFTERKSAVHCTCEICSRDMWFPASKAGSYKTCGGECSKTLKAKTINERERACKTCGKLFTPRSFQLASGQGIFCSQRCNTHGREAMLSEESKKKSTQAFKLALVEGRYKPKTGTESPFWKGGIEERHKRRKESGKAAEALRNYRAKNPEKVREYSKRRNSKKFGRLPPGTVKFIGDSQKWKCVVCRCDISQHFHVDHITPLAKGGQHVPTNIQLLCQTCNVRKSAKDPIDFMQSRGYLL